uniref:Rhodanese domain-containing protein n=1 Tax=Angiostrongylus cantonensis TaxID=6313 RepID=A0A0K0DK31_ANGCA
MTVSVGAMEISAASLAAIVRNADATTLIVDCRCLAEFKQSHVRRALNPFYSKLLQRRLLEDKLFAASPPPPPPPPLTARQTHRSSVWAEYCSFYSLRTGPGSWSWSS